MKKRFLSMLLCAALLFTLAPFSFAADSQSLPLAESEADAAQSLPLEGSEADVAGVNDMPVACQSRDATEPQRDKVSPQATDEVETAAPKTPSVEGVDLPQAANPGEENPEAMGKDEDEEVALLATVSGTCGDNLMWELDTSFGVLTISGTGNMTNYDPGGVAPWYSNRGDIKTVTIGSGVTSIGDYAFYVCSSLTSIDIPDSVTTIGDYAFCGTGLTDVTIPGSVTGIGEWAFSGCTGLTRISASVHNTAYSSIGGVLFDKSKSILIQYPGGKSGAYSIPGSVTTIGEYAFCGCTGLTGVTIPASVTSIGDSAFSGCTGLTGVTIPDSVTSIGSRAFYNCTGLTGVTIPDSVTSIGESAFYGCSSLTGISVSESNTAYATVDGVLFNKGKTTLIQYPGGKSGAYIVPDSVTSIGEGAFSGCTNLTSVTIGNGVTSIGSGAFSGCTNLTSVTIGNGVTSISDYTFNGCTGLTSITIGNGVTSIGVQAFSYCTGLTSITIPDSVTSIKHWAFYGCTGLTGITIPDSVTSIEYEVFKGCTGLTDVYYGGTQAQWNAIRIGNNNEPLTAATVHFPQLTVVASGACGANVTWSLTDTGRLTISGTGAMTNYGIYDAAPWNSYSIVTVAIGNGVTSIGDYAFYNCYNLTSVTIPDSVTSIGYCAFESCTGLTGVTIPASVTSIGEGAFSGCTNLTSVTIPDSVTSIERGAFTGCSSLTSINVDESNTAYATVDGVLFNKGKTTLIQYPGDKSGTYSIPDSVTNIGDYAFCLCTSLTGVTIGNGVTSIGNYAFHVCTALTDVTIPDSVTGIGENAFSDCNGLTSITIGNGVTSIEDYAFAYCGVLTGVTIPNSVTSIGYGAFSSCTNLTDVYYDGTQAQWNAIDIGDDNVPLTSATIHFTSAPHTHSYTSQVTTAATCTTAGVRTYSCTCGDSYTETIPALGHDLTHHDGQAATCTTAGWAAYDTCSRCDYTTYAAIPALGHDYESAVTTAPGCETTGVRTYTCKHDASHTYTEPIPALGHDLTHHDGQAATCTTAGWAAYDTCSRCDYTTYAAIPATGHSWDEGVLDGTVMVYTCTVCGATRTETVTEVATITVGSARNLQGSTVEIPVTLENNPGIAGAYFRLSFDRDALTLTGVARGDGLSTLSFTAPGDLSSDSIRFVWDGQDADSTDGILLTLTFAVDEEAETGDYPIVLTYTTGDVYDQDMEDLTVQIVNGAITVLEYFPGDVNGDGVVNPKDITTLRRYLAGGYGVTVYEQVADVNGDDTVNPKDITHLRRYLVGGYGVTLD